MDAKTNQIIIDYLKEYDPKEIAVFGSYARGEMEPHSDIDILYSLDKKISLFDIVQIKLDLEEKLNRKIDFVSKKGLKEWITPYVMKDLKVIYEK
ncbi:nucleotidyltransferase domain-containing protein [Zunongwangia sp. F260]|uniref:Nucleotidyltransferase domain-containing protein n=1 Tax=Autumnicola lenta TaxID=3075593 RepID=A0ABU3CKP7_9FLAO|nr:nucleotidyltransferase domain-containing protein [Zunongwangia sp. F260]MDT0646925.1 nucleotidyltransferase domain-containing protein [Zunongwangia sp. F260]